MSLKLSPKPVKPASLPNVSAAPASDARAEAEVTRSIAVPSLAGLRLDTIEGEEQMREFSRLLDQGFGLSGGSSFLQDFPVWDERFGPRGEKLIRIGVWEGERLVSCAGVRLAELRVPTGSLMIGLIGAVATADSHRGHGLASRTVSLACEWARERGAAMTLLWGSETALYERLGFETCGVQVRARLEELDLGAPIKDFSRIVLGRGWVPSLMPCLRTRGSGVRLVPEDESWMEAHAHVDWYWLGDPESPRAYAAIGRGIDLTGIVHEWGGESPEELKTLLQLVRMEHPSAELLSSPDLLSAWGLGKPASATPEFLCMARALDVPRLTRAFGVQLPPSDPLFTTPEAAVCRALFGGPGQPALPLWIWGLDAV